MLAYLALQDNGLSVRVAASIAVQVAGAIEYLHGLSPPLLHRDVKVRYGTLLRTSTPSRAWLGLCFSVVCRTNVMFRYAM